MNEKLDKVESLCIAWLSGDTTLFSEEEKEMINKIQEGINEGEIYLLKRYYEQCWIEDKEDPQLWLDSLVEVLDYLEKYFTF